MIGVDVQFRGLAQAIKDLEKFAKRAVPYAMRRMVNDAAFTGREEWQDQIKSAFTLRNRFTQRSIRVVKSTGSDYTAILGSVAPYMGTQETGGTVRGKGKHKSIPMAAAAGQQGSGKRTKLVRAAYRLGAIKAPKGKPVTGTAQHRALVAILQAKRAGRKFVLLARGNGRGKGLYRVMGGRNQVKTRLLYDLSKGAVRVPASHTLGLTLQAVAREMPGIQSRAILSELRRSGVFGY